MSYFSKPASGLKADINRHREAEQRLLKKIEECGDDELGVAAAETYRSILSDLLQYKSDLVSKMGRNR